MICLRFIFLKSIDDDLNVIKIYMYVYLCSEQDCLKALPSSWMYNSRINYIYDSKHHVKL